MRNYRFVLALFFVFAFWVTSTAQDTQVPPDSLVAGLQTKSDRYRIGFQDILEIQVFQHPNLNQRIAVSPNGTIMLFRLDRPLIAVCKTERELAGEIANAYKARFIRDPQVNVVVSEQRSQSVAVIGAVEKPGTYFINRRYHLLEMLAMAGGPNKESGTRILVARTGSASQCRDKGDQTDGDQVAVMDFKIRDVQQGKQTLWMEPGDVVSLLKADIIYVYGNVNKQGTIEVREPITLTQALVSAEGLKAAAKKDKIRILRQIDGKADREELVYNLNDIDKGKVRDPFLEPNDIVAVSEDKMKSILYGLANSIKSSVPSAVYRLP
ncbi:MAG: polysaccharide biosynthesis/export family protein [Pyrinomonadaceae bacterium]